MRLRSSLAISLVIFSVLTASLSFSAKKVAAINGSAWQAGRIIDDTLFTDGGSMSVDQIQAFLNNQVPNCDMNGTKPASDWGRSDLTHAQFATQVKGWPGPPYVCLRNYYEIPKTTPGPGVPANNYSGSIPAGAISAAQMIYNAAQQYRISPKVLLVKIRAESAGPLTNDSWPLQNQYTYAMGAHCPDSGVNNSANCDPNYAGFSIQISESAALFRYYLDNMNQPWWPYKKLGNNTILYNPNTSCGSSVVNITTMATAALYTYTPYQPNAGALSAGYGTATCGAYGNRNFWLYYNDWFGSTWSSPLIKGSSSTVYVLGNDSSVAYGVPSGETLNAYGLGNATVTTVSDSFIASLNTSNLLTPLFMKPGDGTIYLADSGKAYGIASGAVCTQWSLPCGQANLVSTLPPSITNAISYQNPLSNLMLNRGMTYVVDNGIKYPFIVPSDRNLSPWKDQSVTSINSVNTASLITGTPKLYANHFVQSPSGVIYYYDRNADKFFSFSSFQQFKNWWDGSEVTLDVFSNIGLTPPSSTPIPDFIINGSSTYAVGGNIKYTLPGTPTVSAINISTYPGFTNLLNSKVTTAIDVNKGLRFTDGSIMMLVNSTLHPIATMNDVNLLVSGSAINVPDPIRNAYPVDTFAVPSGRIVKLAGSSSIYIYDDNHYLWSFDTMSEVNASLSWVNNVLETSASNLTITGYKRFTGLIRTNGSYYIEQANGSLRKLPDNILNSQKDILSVPVSGAVANRFTFDNKAVQFVHTDTGTIFAVQSNQLRALSTFNTYGSMGGSSNNTIELPVKALGALTVGDPL